MKGFLITTIAPLLLLVSCKSQTDAIIESNLEKYVVERAGEVDVKYKLVDYTVVDTLTVQSEIDRWSPLLDRICFDVDIEDFKKKRNQEFVSFRNDPDYEEKVMRGSLKDASPWCTEIRVITEKADSLIANWDNVSKYSYDYQYLCAYYTDRAASFYGVSEVDIIDFFKENKDAFIFMESSHKMPKDSIVGYNVIHKYSVHNPVLDKRIELKDSVNMDGSFKIKKITDKTNVFSLLGM